MRSVSGVFEVAAALACHAVSSAVVCLQSRDRPETDTIQRAPAAVVTSPMCVITARDRTYHTQSL